jgi:hypothetical protein
VRELGPLDRWLLAFLGFTTLLALTMQVLQPVLGWAQ